MSKQIRIEPSRWLVYSLIGTLFGIIDWYAPDLLYGLTKDVWQHPAMALLRIAFVWGVWLVPALPIAVYEARVSWRDRSAAGAVVLTWLAAMTSYYLYYASLLAFVGLNQMEMLHISARHDPLFGQYWRDTFRSLILAQWLEWSPVALIGGAITGWSTGWLYRIWQTRRSAPIPSID